MASQQTPSTFTERMTAHLPLVERILLAGLLIGIVLTLMQIDSTLPKLSLIGLSVTFFLLAYRPVDVPGEGAELLGFSQLLGLSIVPKVLWISSAVSAIGIAFVVFESGNPGSKNMLLIGGTTIVIGTLIFLALLASGVKHLRLVTPVLLRAIPLCLVDFYIVFN